MPSAAKQSGTMVDIRGTEVQVDLMGPNDSNNVSEGGARVAPGREKRESCLGEQLGQASQEAVLGVQAQVKQETEAISLC